VCAAAPVRKGVATTDVIVPSWLLLQLEAAPAAAGTSNHII
jgi:hypothetical protein